MRAKQRNRLDTIVRIIPTTQNEKRSLRRFKFFINLAGKDKFASTLELPNAGGYLISDKKNDKN